MNETEARAADATNDAEEKSAITDSKADNETGCNTKEAEDNTILGGSLQEGGGHVSVRPVFLGNLSPGFKSEDIAEIFSRPIVPADAPAAYDPVAVDRVDIKKGFCFVFLKDVPSVAEKIQIESFVALIQGMYVNMAIAAIASECVFLCHPVPPFQPEKYLRCISF